MEKYTLKIYVHVEQGSQFIDKVTGVNVKKTEVKSSEL